MTAMEALPIFLAIVASVPGVLAIYAQWKKDKAEADLKKEEILSKKSKVDSESNLDNANASKIVSDTLRNVVADLRSEMRNQDEAHAREIQAFRKQFEDERTALITRLDAERSLMKAQLATLEAKLEDALNGIRQLHDQIRELGGTPRYPADPNLFTTTGDNQ